MSFYHPEMTTCSPASKGKRPIDSVDLDDAGPPTKISRTDLGPEGDFQQEGMSSAGHAASFVGVENLKADLKHRNTIACCPPHSDEIEDAGQIINDIISWAFKESIPRRPIIAIIANDDTDLKTYYVEAQRLLPTSQVFLIANPEHESAYFNANGKTGKCLLLFSPEDFLRFSLREPQTITKNLAFIVYDTTVPGIRNRDVFLQKISDVCCCPEPPLREPRLLVLLQSSRWDRIQDADVAKLKSSCNAGLLRIAKFEHGKLGSMDFPTELMITYVSTHVQETPLCQRLRESNIAPHLLDPHFRDANLVLHQLGPCAADLVLRNAFSYSDWADGDLHSQEETAQAQVRDLVRHWPFRLPNLDLSSQNMNVSHKFHLLVQQLEAQQTLGTDFRGIVFVQKRIVAQLLVALIQSLTPRLQFLRPLSLTNHRVSSDSEVLERTRQQFISGRYNVLFVTKSFEDVDLPKVSVVILFDVFESQIFRAYARNCVSNKGGHLIHMLEQGNSTHQHALSSSALDLEMAEWAATLKDDCLNCAPPRPPQENNNPYNSASEEDQDLEAVQDPITGHRIRKDRSTISFYRYAAQADAQAKRQGLFEYVSENNTWRCMINLAGTPVDGLSGAAAPTKALARKEAAFMACRSLQLSGLLDSAFFFRTHARTIELHDNTLDYLDPDSGSIHERPHLPLTPEFWRNSISTSPPHFLYPIVVSALSPVLSANEKAPLCILTRAPLPLIPQFQLSRNGDALTIQLQRNLAISLDAKRLDLIHKFTVRLCRISMNKPFEVSSSAELGCMFAPLRRTRKPPDVKGYDISEDIDWEMVSAASEKWAIPFVDLTRLREEIEDVVIQDRAVEFTNRCEILRIREDMTPLSEVEGQGGKTLLAQCYCRRKNFEGLVYPNQPILEVVRMPAPANYVNPPTSSVEVPAKTTQFLIPECCHKLTVSASTFRMGYLLPSIMHKIDELLLVKQLNAKNLDYCVRDDMLTMATSSPLAGNDYNYERLELLGDAFLKYLSSTYVFALNLNGAEGELHTARQRFISNRQLCDIVSSWGLPGYIQLKPFNIKSWLPPGMNIADSQKDPTVNGGIACDSQPELKSPQQNEDTKSAGKRSKNKKKRLKKKASISPIANKTVADVAEAIIGAAYISGGRDAAFKASKALMIPFVGVEEWADFGRKASTPQLNSVHALEPSVVHSIEQITGLKFQQPSLLRLTLTHASLSSMEMKDHQRFEFLGDAVLDFLVVRYLYNKDHHASPGQLSITKSLMVSNSILAAICVWSGLHRFVHVTQQQRRTVLDYEKTLRVREAAETTSTSKEATRVRHFWMEIDVPKVLSDVIESIIGAIYISDGFSQEGVEIIFGKMLLPFYQRYIFAQSDATSS